MISRSGPLGNADVQVIPAASARARM